MNAYLSGHVNGVSAVIVLTAALGLAVAHLRGWTR